jgi:hypothetical protein
MGCTATSQSTSCQPRALAACFSPAQSGVLGSYPIIVAAANAQNAVDRYAVLAKLKVCSQSFALTWSKKPSGQRSPPTALRSAHSALVLLIKELGCSKRVLRHRLPRRLPNLHSPRPNGDSTLQARLALWWLPIMHVAMKNCAEGALVDEARSSEAVWPCVNGGAARASTLMPNRVFAAYQQYA